MPFKKPKLTPAQRDGSDVDDRIHKVLFTSGIIFILSLLIAMLTTTLLATTTEMDSHAMTLAALGIGGGIWVVGSLIAAIYFYFSGNSSEKPGTEIPLAQQALLAPAADCFQAPAYSPLNIQGTHPSSVASAEETQLSM